MTKRIEDNIDTEILINSPMKTLFVIISSSDFGNTKRKSLIKRFTSIFVLKYITK